MDIQSLESLTRQDQTTSYFGPYGLSTGGPILTPEASLSWLQEIVSAYDIDATVPAEVRSYYEASRRLHTYGFFEYRFFVIAEERAPFTAEFAVRKRFLDSYEGRVQIERRKGSQVESAVIEATDPWSFDSAFQGWRREKWRLAGQRAFNGSFRAHLEWARTTLDLGRYFTKTRLDALADLRNLAAHPSMDTRVGPPDSSRSIEFTWRFINALWGIPADEAFY